MNRIQFFKTALKNYKTIGAVRASSRFVAKRIQRALGDVTYIVEYGAGDGVLTKEILKILPNNGRIVAVELDRTFLSELAKIKDKRLTVLNEDVIAVSKNLRKLALPKIDAVVSGIPFTFLTSDVRDEIVRATAEALNKDGMFLVYQHSPLMVPILKRYFRTTQTFLELRNFPPNFIMCGRK